MSRIISVTVGLDFFWGLVSGSSAGGLVVGGFSGDLFSAERTCGGAPLS